MHVLDLAYASLFLVTFLGLAGGAVTLFCAFVSIWDDLLIKFMPLSWSLSRHARVLKIAAALLVLGCMYLVILLQKYV